MNSSSTFDYGVYWRDRSIEIRRKLMERELIFYKWIPNDSRVLDIAAGNSLLPSLFQKEKQCDVTVYDIAPDIISVQRSVGIKGFVKNLTNADFIISEQYDYIIASEILEHLSMPEKLIPILRLHAKKLIISVPNSAFYKFRLQLLSGHFIKQWNSHPSEHLRFWSHNEFTSWLIAQGLTVDNMEPSNGLDIGPIKLFKYFPNLFGHQICYLVKKK